MSPKKGENGQVMTTEKTIRSHLTKVDKVSHV